MCSIGMKLLPNGTPAVNVMFYVLIVVQLKITGTNTNIRRNLQLSYKVSNTLLKSSSTVTVM